MSKMCDVGFLLMYRILKKCPFKCIYEMEIGARTPKFSFLNNAAGIVSQIKIYVKHRRGVVKFFV